MELALLITITLLLIMLSISLIKNSVIKDFLNELQQENVLLKMKLDIEQHDNDNQVIFVSTSEPVGSDTIKEAFRKAELKKSNNL